VDLHSVDTSPPNKMPSSSTDHKYTPSNDSAIGSAPAGDLDDNNYVTRPGHKNDPIPVQSDEDLVIDQIDAKTADSKTQLGTYTLTVIRMRKIFSGANSGELIAKDDKEAIDVGNILVGGSEFRGEGPRGGYREPRG
jgi:hypothetical protein